MLKCGLTNSKAKTYSNQGEAMREINGIIVHCTATHPEWMSRATSQEKVDEIRRWHMAKGWSDIGYHYLIDRDGTVVAGRPVNKQGAHVRGHNRGTIGVSLLGGHGAAATDRFEEHFTTQQFAALTALIWDLQEQYGRNIPVTGHNEYANKGCPGFQVSKYIS